MNLLKKALLILWNLLSAAGTLGYYSFPCKQCGNDIFYSVSTSNFLEDYCENCNRGFLGGE